MSDFAFGATFAMLVMTAIVLLTGYCVCVLDYWRDSKLHARARRAAEQDEREALRVALDNYQHGKRDHG